MKISRPDDKAVSVPDFIQALVNDAVARLAPKRVFLFGSRARGDAERGSDYDIAIDAPGLDDAQWTHFVLDTEENLEALLDIDLVRLDTATTNLRRIVEKEGRLLYGR